MTDLKMKDQNGGNENVNRNRLSDIKRGIRQKINKNSWLMKHSTRRLRSRRKWTATFKCTQSNLITKRPTRKIHLTVSEIQFVL